MSLDLRVSDHLLEAGIDEAGRGCLAGPVAAAAVILPNNVNLGELNDSKQLSKKKRESLRETIVELALAWHVAMVAPARIDEINIERATFEAMHTAAGNLAVKPEFLAVDGRRFIPFEKIPHACIVKGDGRYQNIAAASILAKTFRDDLMAKLHATFPQYGWDRNKGYPTVAHRTALLEHGLSPHHRKSFSWQPPRQLSLFPKD